jgi:tetratricopeptide (TPR) repeat protein
VVAYELLTGTRPFERDSPTAEAAAHAHEPVPPASERAPGLFADVDRVFARALAKEPLRRFESARAFVGALRSALAAREQPTKVLAAPPPPPPALPPRARRRRALAPALVAALLLTAGAAGAVLAAVMGGDDDSTAPRSSRTITEQITQPGTTIVETATEAPEPPPPSPPASPAAADPHALNDQGFALMQEGRWEEALPLLEEAVAGLEGSYSGEDPYEAYANYNLGRTLLELGRCDEALDPLEQSQELQGERKEIRQARKAAERCLDRQDDGDDD